MFVGHALQLVLTTDFVVVFANTVHDFFRLLCTGIDFVVVNDNT